jgi:hypothetical protein
MIPFLFCFFFLKKKSSSAQLLIHLKVHGAFDDNKLGVFFQEKKKLQDQFIHFFFFFVTILLIKFVNGILATRSDVVTSVCFE